MGINGRGWRSIISKRQYDRDHPRPVANAALAPWVAERRRRRNRRRERRGKGRRDG